MLQTRLAARPAAALNSVVADRAVIVGQLFTGFDPARGADPDGLVDYLRPAVRRARMVDETGDVAADGRIAAPDSIDPVDPDAPLRQVLDLAAGAVLVPYELTGIVDDALVLVDRFGREYAEPVQLRFFANDPGK